MWKKNINAVENEITFEMVENYTFSFGSRPNLAATLCGKPYKRPQAQVILSIVIMKLELWRATSCKLIVMAELSSRPC